MSDAFVVTYYGPSPRSWCRTCRTGAPLQASPNGTPRADDVTQVQQSHTCDQPASPWPSQHHGVASLAARGAGER